VLALYAPGAAVAHFTRAIDAAGQLSTSAEPGLIRARGVASEAPGNFHGAQADYDLALASTIDPATVWQALLDLGSLWAGRDYQQAGHWFERALKAFRLTADQRHVTVRRERHQRFRRRPQCRR
jgi:hypothetical protein